MEAQSGQVRWQIEQGWQTYLCKNSHKNVQDVIPPTQSFATSTTTASLSLATFARLVRGTGQEVVPFETSQLAVVAGETRGLKEVVALASHQQALIVKPAPQIATLRLTWEASVRQLHHR